ncbi:hypothetical protein HMPREF0083_05406 [Aneurinibacillus aneurinilyticus ATCC 12856]|uniref:Uncharacterized protein n=1 Tax=Aneurinibacillus aneurinilyticus ATCC 12856 TaxID=649747 RepID=U1WU11_ANEAE|nr:hypothetical protein HMPREF0083_05406 [Aneurinibacillus aneurinilyticus ATCC 12856]
MILFLYMMYKNFFFTIFSCFLYLSGIIKNRYGSLLSRSNE